MQTASLPWTASCAFNTPPNKAGHVRPLAEDHTCIESARVVPQYSRAESRWRTRNTVSQLCPNRALWCDISTKTTIINNARRFLFVTLEGSGMLICMPSGAVHLSYVCTFLVPTTLELVFPTPRAERCILILPFVPITYRLSRIGQEQSLAESTDVCGILYGREGRT